MKMKCQKCAERATLHITEIDDEGAYEEVHLCHKCAQQYLNESDEEPTPTPASAGVVVTAGEPVASSTKCPVCKTTFGDFRSTGRLGCPHDYEVFREELRPLLENIHGSLRHIGKVPRRLPEDTRTQTQIIQLRQELQQAISIEDYERAAELRDQIDGLQNKR